MTDPTISKTGRGSAAGVQDLQVHPKDAGEEQRDLSPEQILRWAKLVADGHELFPTGLLPVQEERMLQQVRRCRRARLVRYIARQIAGDIARDSGGSHGGNDVET
jgi:hypothetical protein